MRGMLGMVRCSEMGRGRGRTNQDVGGELV